MNNCVMNFKELFGVTKPIIAMLHLKGDSKMSMSERAKQEIKVYYDNGIDAVLVENYFGNSYDCEEILAYLKKEYPDKLYGVNILGDYEKAFELAEKYGARFVQIDSVCGHLSPADDEMYAEKLMSLMENRSFLVLGGLRFKYHSVRSNRTLEEDANLTKLRCDAVVTTGDGTGKDCPTEKLSKFRTVLEDYPLIVGAGVTPDNVCEKLQFADGVIIGSWLKEGHYDYGDVCEEYVKTFTDKVKNFRMNI